MAIKFYKNIHLVSSSIYLTLDGKDWHGPLQSALITFQVKHTVLYITSSGPFITLEVHRYKIYYRFFLIIYIFNIVYRLSSSICVSVCIVQQISVGLVKSTTKPEMTSCLFIKTWSSKQEKNDAKYLANFPSLFCGLPYQRGISAMYAENQWSSSLHVYGLFFSAYRWRMV